LRGERTGPCPRVPTLKTSHPDQTTGSCLAGTMARQTAAHGHRAGRVGRSRYSSRFDARMLSGVSRADGSARLTPPTASRGPLPPHSATIPAATMCIVFYTLNQPGYHLWDVVRSSGGSRTMGLSIAPRYPLSTESFVESFLVARLENQCQGPWAYAADGSSVTTTAEPSCYFGPHLSTIHPHEL
jgi:hypothetical protein